MNTTLALRAAAALLLAALLAACGPAASPRAAPVPPREVGAFVVRLGADTVALEEFARTATQLEGRQVLRTPRTSLREYSAALRADGSMSRFEIRFRDTPGAPVTQQSIIEFEGDSASVRFTRGESTQTFRVAIQPGALPFVGYSVALYEIAFGQLRNGAGESFATTMVPLGAASGMPLSLRTAGTDTVVVTNIAGESRARVDGAGRLLGWDGSGSTLQISADRAFGLDLDRMAAEFAARDAAGRGLGSLSPRDSVRAEVGGASVTLTYGRPATRGRQIFGSVVPFGEVWRTGANQATQLRTDRDLDIGGTLVPAGTYTLFTVPGPDGWTLIVNRQTDQWGTQHDPARDLARIPMRRETLSVRVEQFTIALAPGAAGSATLQFSWDDTRASVPVRVR